MKRWHFWAGVLISAACIAFVLWQVEDWHRFGRSFIEAHWWLLIPIVASYFAVMFFRALRWRFILNQCGRVSLRNSFVSILVCYMGNNVFPLRAGEFMRVFLIGRQEESITYSAALATVVVERLFDFLVMLVFLAAVLMIVPFSDEYKRLEAAVHHTGTATLIAAALLFSFLMLLHARTDVLMPWMEKVMAILPQRPRKAALDSIKRFASGLVIMGRPRALVALVGMSVFVWVVNLLPVWLSGLAFNIDIDFFGCMFMLVIGSAAASIPATPGFFGTFHAFNQQGLVFLKPEVDAGTALSFAVVLHSCYYFPLIAAGAIALWREGYSLMKLREESQELEQARDT